MVMWGSALLPSLVASMSLPSTKPALPPLPSRMVFNLQVVVSFFLRDSVPYQALVPVSRQLVLLVNYKPVQLSRLQPLPVQPMASHQPSPLLVLVTHLPSHRHNQAHFLLREEERAQPHPLVFSMALMMVPSYQQQHSVSSLVVPVSLRHQITDNY